MSDSRAYLSGSAPSPLVLVLLPVFNGAEFLAAQLDSIMRQSWQDFRVIIRDDHSSDSSREIIADYVSRYPAKIFCCEDELGNLGACGSFSYLMRLACDEIRECWQGRRVYVALADQDDVWLYDKLWLSVATLERAQSKHPELPLLVHSDLQVVDRQLSLIAASFLAYQGLRPHQTSFRSQLLSSTVTGCTVLINQRCLELALPIPSAAVMHDWWLALIASKFGQIIFLPHCLVLYRQHGKNTLGARRNTGYLQVLERLLGRRAKTDRQFTQRALLQSAEQAEAFRARFGTTLTTDEQVQIDRMSRLPHRGMWAQRLHFRLLRWQGSR
jgi:glycosyltransferase involved in cell wall biosynthesis